MAGVGQVWVRKLITRLGSLTFARLFLSLNVALGLVGIDRSRVGGTELTAQWYVTPSGDKLISYYGPEEECELYGSWATVNQTMETIRGFDENASPMTVEDDIFSDILNHCQDIHYRLYLRKEDFYRGGARRDWQVLNTKQADEETNKIFQTKHTTPADLYKLNLLNSIMIFPGTKWCGVGSVASHFNDLGYHEEADRCCRGHDLCFDALMAGQCKNGLCNNSPYTRSPCTCDRQFVSCLKSAETRIANALGRVFFNIGGMNCYKFEHPIKRCLEFVDVAKSSKVPTWLLKALHVHPEPQRPRCKHYELDLTKPKVWQFFETFYDETTHLIKDTSVRAPRLIKAHTKKGLQKLRAGGAKLRGFRANTPRHSPSSSHSKKMSPFARFLVDVFMSIVDPYK